MKTKNPWHTFKQLTSDWLSCYMTHLACGHGVRGSVNTSFSDMEANTHTHTLHTYIHTQIATVFSLGHLHWLKNNERLVIVVLTYSHCRATQRRASSQREASEMTWLSRRHSQPLNLFSMDFSIKHSQHNHSGLSLLHKSIVSKDCICQSITLRHCTVIARIFILVTFSHEYF